MYHHPMTDWQQPNPYQGFLSEDRTTDQILRFVQESIANGATEIRITLNPLTLWSNAHVNSPSSGSTSGRG